ncbi:MULTISPECIES: hypothetical protein [unclassified Colwellia]|uniref:hypothetical protein n=1 Tax=unclassified Colwellia TaxID=196834 RepID=UPI0015F3D02B|nr:MULTISPECIES: hypothetical protein [unclassified Colwellia]MBA6230957.1 hypothetical protein [Colwellia sp. MB02u-7]MBA6234888.1 hypothetical protein [Colwellia sp. MB02u-11]MBA6255752.1 hypothetical protein [Colwellia sp. MB3u-28]MBA6261893.1 hypothetical protein [Colwellia sp. MB3u-41]MBA6301443.1 hypothetical protein [Colwellia sp. MB3u-22]
MYAKTLNFICFFYCFFAFSGLANNYQSIAVKTNEIVAGKALHQYANIWWQWTRTMGDENSPVRDKTGQYCDVKQSGDVWFLAGGYGTSKIKRHCIIPYGKYIFFPIINMGYWPERDVSRTCEEVKQESALNNSELYFVYAELNGYSIPNMRNNRIKSNNCFDLHELLAEIEPTKKVYPAATDGYWLMLRPLSKGIHSLKFNAQYHHQTAIHGNMMQDIEYTIEVK